MIKNKSDLNDEFLKIFQKYIKIQVQQIATWQKIHLK
jgi:hypothetical protein